VNSCSICQYNKYNTHSPYGLLQPLPLPEQVWEDISMDFITNLPLTNQKSTIWVVVDRLSKFAHFIALPSTFTAATLAPVFISEIYRLHGAPKTIVSDRDRVFVSQFWRALFKGLGTTLAFSSSYHPQTDGQTEVLNRCLETYLRCFVSEEPKLWLRYLPLAEFWYNTSFHSAIGMTPFEALYGRKPPNMVHYSAGQSTIASLDELLTQKTQILKILKENLLRARNRMIQQANRHRQDHNFAEGDWVYLKLQPYRQNSVHHRTSQKLAKRFYGPFRIIKRIGKVAYQLELPVSSRIHPVFHVSLLKPCQGQPTSQISPIPDPAMFPPISPIPIALLDRRFSAIGKEEFLVQWKGLPSSEASWIDKTEFQHQFPEVNLEDKICLEEVGNVTDTNSKLIAPKENGPFNNIGPSNKRIIKKPKRYED
ncbi:transposon Tf2-1 polyprotein, partial [Trifolium pratense]